MPITVERANKPPVVETASVLTLPAIPLNITPPVDPDGDPLTITVAEVPERGAIKDGERALAVGDELTPEALAGLVLEPGARGRVRQLRVQGRRPRRRERHARRCGSTCPGWPHPASGAAPSAEAAPTVQAAPPVEAAPSVEAAPPGREATPPPEPAPRSRAAAGGATRVAAAG